MRISEAAVMGRVSGLALLGWVAVSPAWAQQASASVDALLPPPTQSSAVEAASGMADMLDSATIGVSSDELLAAFQGAADAGQPIALWRLGVMYENGDGVEKDPVKALSYFSRIANDFANTPPRSLEADIVAQAFVKLGDYYRAGLEVAAIAPDMRKSRALYMHAASYFGYADAQYIIGMLYLTDAEFGINPLQGARWLSLAARKGHTLAQAKLGDALFNGEIGAEPQKDEGLMWLVVAQRYSTGTADEANVSELTIRALSVATPEERSRASAAASELELQLGD